MQEFPQHLGPLFVEGGVHFLGTRRAGREGFQTLFIELVDGVAHGLLSASEVFGYSRCDLASGARQEDLATTEDEGIGRSQAVLQRPALLRGKRAYEDRRFHAHYRNS